MATQHTIMKNGKPVKRFWSQKIKSTDNRFPTTYPVYFYGDMRSSGLVNDAAPKTLSEAQNVAQLMVESPDDEWTHATVYKLQPISRYGTEFDYRAMERQRATDSKV